MRTTAVVTKLSELGRAFQTRADHIRVEVQGSTLEEFIPKMVVHATTLPELAGFDPYEIDAIIRDKCVAV